MLHSAENHNPSVRVRVRMCACQYLSLCRNQQDVTRESGNLFDSPYSKLILVDFNA